MKLSTLSLFLASAISISGTILPGLDALDIERRGPERKSTTRTTATPTHTTTSTPLPTLSQLHGEAAAAGGVLAADTVQGNGQAVGDNGSSECFVHINGFGAGPGKGHTLNASIASSVALGSGADGTYGSAAAGTIAAVMNPNATNVKLTSVSFGNSSTFQAKNGSIITIAYASSTSIVEDDQGDYAIYWAWAYTVAGPGANYTRGDNGGRSHGMVYAVGQYSGVSTSPGGSTDDQQFSSIFDGGEGYTFNVGIDEGTAPYTPGTYAGQPATASFNENAGGAAGSPVVGVVAVAAAAAASPTGAADAVRGGGPLNAVAYVDQDTASATAG